MTQTLSDRLKAFEGKLQVLRNAVLKQDAERIYQSELRAQAEGVASEWFSEVVGPLHDSAPPAETVEAYSRHFGRLLELGSAPSCRKRTLVGVLDDATRHFRRDIRLPVQSAPSSSQVDHLQQLLATVAAPAQAEYLEEAIRCARHKLYRGAAVLGWCAAVDQIHSAIERIGFPKFNTASSQMASQTVGRYKKFNQVQNVHSLSELQQVFDTVLLWIIEGMGLIDANQHTRLKSCFDLRSQCAHPGQAPVTEYNLLSFFSDLNEIVFKNPALAPPATRSVP